MQRNAPAGAWFHETIEVPAGAFSHAILPPQAFTLARDYEAKAEEQRQEFTAELVASFNEAQSAWDAYCEHLISTEFCRIVIAPSTDIFTSSSLPSFTVRCH